MTSSAIFFTIFVSINISYMVFIDSIAFPEDSELLDKLSHIQ